MAVGLFLSDGTNTVYFVGGSSVLLLSTGGWNTVSENSEFIWETLELVSDTTDSSVRTEKKTLDLLLKEARIYATNELSSNPVWLYWNADGESQKRSLVLDGSTEILSDDIWSPLMGINSIKVKLAIKRKPFWEATSTTSASTTGLSVTGGEWTIGNNAGTEDQRIEEAYFTIRTTAKQRIWAGIRPIYEGVGDFDPLWECEDGTNYVDATDTADGTASGGNKVTISFVAATLSRRFSVSIDDVIGIGDANHFVGKYQVIGRCKVDSVNTQVRVQLRSGYFYLITTETIVQDTIIDGQTSWDLVELGEVQFPPMGNRDGREADQLDYMSLTIWAERLSGSGTLDFDCLILIPSEHYFYGEATSLVADDLFEAYVSNNDDFYAVGNGIGAWGNIDFNMPNWKYPIGGGHMVVAAAEASSHTLTGTVDVLLKLLPRWHSYRA